MIKDIVSKYLLDIFDGVSRLNIKSDCLTGKGFDKNLHIYISNNNDKYLTSP
jgi:hypothetical protein